jgi:hypothetical protein
MQISIGTLSLLGNNLKTANRAIKDYNDARAVTGKHPTILVAVSEESISFGVHVTGHWLSVVGEPLC